MMVPVGCDPWSPADDVIDSKMLCENDDDEVDLADLLKECDNVLETPSVVFSLPVNLSDVQDNELGISYGSDNRNNEPTPWSASHISCTSGNMITARQPIPAAGLDTRAVSRESDLDKSTRLVDVNSNSLAPSSAGGRSTLTGSIATNAFGLVRDGDVAFDTDALLLTAATEGVVKNLKNPPCRTATEAAETAVCIADVSSAVSREGDRLASFGGAHRIASPRPRSDFRPLTSSRGDLTESPRHPCDPSSLLKLSSVCASSSPKPSCGIWKVESIVDLRIRLRRVMESQTMPADVRSGSRKCRESAAWRVKGSSSSGLKLVVSKPEPSAPDQARIC
jgi:hypothetical protein